MAHDLDLETDADYVEARDKMRESVIGVQMTAQEARLSMTGFVIGWAAAIKVKNLAHLYDLRIESSNGQPLAAAISLAQQFSDQLPSPPGAQELARIIKTGCCVIAHGVPWAHAALFMERAKELQVQARAIRVKQAVKAPEADTDKTPTTPGWSATR